jgi:hypothetical protein
MIPPTGYPVTVASVLILEMRWLRLAEVSGAPSPARLRDIYSTEMRDTVPGPLPAVYAMGARPRWPFRGEPDAVLTIRSRPRVMNAQNL